MTASLEWCCCALPFGKRSIRQCYDESGCLSICICLLREIKLLHHVVSDKDCTVDVPRSNVGGRDVPMECRPCRMFTEHRICF